MNVPKLPVVYPDASVPIVAVIGSRDRPVRFHRHRDRDWEFCYMRSGTAEFRVGAARWRLRTGDLLVVRPDEPDACVSWRGCRMMLIARESFLRKLPVDVRFTRTAPLVVAKMAIPRMLPVALPQRPRVEHLLERVAWESLSNEPTKGTMCAVILAQWLLEIARSAPQQVGEQHHPIGVAARRTVEALGNELQGNLAHPWTLAELVSRSGYGPTQLSYLFNHVLGASPIHWLAQQRVQRACRLLADSDKGTIQIALEVGFGSRSQFHRAFRGVMGTAPGRYRAIIRHEQRP